MSPNGGPTRLDLKGLAFLAGVVALAGLEIWGILIAIGSFLR